MTTYASKTLAERNNDPAPWLWDGAHTDTSYARSGLPREGYVVSPRPEFQHGKLEANPILANARHYRKTSDTSTEGVLELLWAVTAGAFDWATPDQVAHARRVLTLWLAVFA